MEVSIDPRIWSILESNPSLYGLKLKCFWTAEYEPVNEIQIAEAFADLRIFIDRQNAIFRKEEINQGDWVKLKNGEYSRVTVNSWKDSIQIGGTYGSSVFVYASGSGSYSGNCGDTIRREDLVRTKDFKEGMAWIFSKECTGGGRGVHLPLLFRVWEVK